MKIINIKSLIFLIIALLILGGGCRKDIDEFVVDDVRTHTQTGRNLLNDSTAWVTRPTATAPVNQLFDELEDPQTLVTETVANPLGRIVEMRTNDGVLLNLNCGLLRGFVNGGGNVTIKVRSILKKGDFVRYMVPTVSNGLPLISGGSVQILVTQNGRELGLNSSAGLSIRVPAANNQPNPQMAVFTADSTRDVNWILRDSMRATVSTWIDSSRAGSPVVAGYTVFSDRFRWINCDYFWNVPRAEVCVRVQDTAVYNPQNTAVFAVYTNNLSVIRLYPDANRRMWCAQLPVGQAVTYVTLSKVDNNYFLGTQQGGLTASPLVSITPTQRTLQQIIDFLGTL